MASGSFTISITGSDVTSSEPDGRSVCYTLDDSCMENVTNMSDPSGSGSNCTYDGDPNAAASGGGTQHCFTCYDTTYIGSYTVNYT